MNTTTRMAGWNLNGIAQRVLTAICRRVRAVMAMIAAAPTFEPVSGVE
jgi:hypothetical protein